MFQRFRLSDSSERLSRGVLNQIIEHRRLFFGLVHEIAD
jgi:hypothetical protein